MKKTLTDALSKRALSALAGKTIYARGENYADASAVSGLRLIQDRLRARVAGSDDYDVALWCDGERLDYDCSCPMGLGGDCCKHVVAAGLAWLEKQGKSQSAKRSIQDETQSLEAYLRNQPHETLVELLLAQCDKDETLHQTLLSRAAMARGTPDIKELKKRVRDALAIRGFVPYHRMGDVMRRAENALSLIAELLAAGHVTLAAELAHYAMERGIKAYGDMDDSSGFFGQLLRDIGDLHLEAFTRASSDWPLKGKQLFKLKQLDDWGFFPFQDYAPLLDANEYRQYRKLAQLQWDKVPAVVPVHGRRGTTIYDESICITAIMEELARHEKDIDQLIAVKSRDLGSPYQFLKIAEILQDAQRSDEALGWAEQGIKAFKNDYDSRLVGFTAAAYQRHKRMQDAVELIWTWFRQQPGLESWKALKSAAEKAGDWQGRRKQALEHLKTLDGSDKSGHRSVFRQSGTGLLIDIFLWEKAIDMALATANTHGAWANQWLQLATACEMPYPAEAARIYRERLDAIVDRKNNPAYDEGAGLVKKIRALMGKTGDKVEFNRWLEEVRIRHKQKRNYMQRLEGVKPFSIKK